MDGVDAVLRLAWPTTNQAWPAWAVPGRPPRSHTEDGAPVHALAADDLLRWEPRRR
ncbi:hypothetical protein [Streptomyces sp. NPDC001594]|uniref:hypothetical protein n=1 Tax=Streptomyces sp. NPDC001594 TaxID=3364590 RepID=UPI003689F5BB